MHSVVRESLGLPFAGKTFHDRFLIADVVMQPGFPAERWFWFDPPFHRGGSVRLHRQADDVWRIDFQLGWDCDPEVEKAPERVRERVRAMLGPDVPFELEWVNITTFALPPAGQVPPRPHPVPGRCRPSGESVRRARRQCRRAGCR